MKQLSLNLQGKSLRTFFDEIAQSRDKNPLTHGLHPYPAKFIPHIPRALIAEYGIGNELVVDPMCGSGTTLIEAAVAGHSAIGIDLNPIATLIAGAKTTVLGEARRAQLHSLAGESLAQSRRYTTSPNRLSSEVRDDELPTFHRRELWFNDHVARELVLIRRSIEALKDAESSRFAQCAMSAIIVAVSNQESETRWCAKPNAIPVGGTLNSFARRLVVSLSKELEYAQLHPAATKVHLGDARNVPVASGTVGLIVTSPPYANAHDYYLYNKLRMFWLGFDVRSVQKHEMGSRHRHSDKKEDIGEYLKEMRDVFREMHRLLIRKRKAVIVVADAVIRGELHSMLELLPPLAEESGLTRVEMFEFAHKAFNAAFQRGFGSSAKKTTHVLVFERP